MAQLSDTSLFSDANLVAYYKLSDVNDSKGSNNLTNNNTVTFVAGKYGNAADFGSSNTNKSLTVASNLSINGNGAMSVSFWVKMYSFAAVSSLIFHNSTGGADRNLQVFTNTDNTLNFNGAGVSDSTPFSDTASYHHIVITRSGAGAVLGYLDGTQVVSLSAGGSGVTQNVFEIGVGSGSNFADCIIDDVGVFNDVLTAGEVSTLFAAGAGGGGAFLLNFV